MSEGMHAMEETHTSQYLICWGEAHAHRHELRSFSRPLDIGSAAFIAEAESLGWRRIGRQYRCPECVADWQARYGAR